MFHALGVGGGGSLVGGVAAALAVIPFMFYKYGAAIRARSRFNPKGRKPADKKDDVETGPAPVVLEDPEEGASEDASVDSDESSSSSTVAGDEGGEKNTDVKQPEHKREGAPEHTEASASTEKVKSEENP
jgi:hypothetical protein